ncbi:hypothetical protein IB259_07630 [Achromobacter sp. ACM04]|uniref:hypothetical protein n=1 Tax=Achromobacter sp. ACM04 TaxID=2769312 RepID=UPI001786EA04|nr:hypothetical protein [Achromobacter sp. ACM04]MBD9419116.1 hypothetical protein [Achromobacter sp. ACM04]
MDCNSEKAVFERQVATSTLLMSPALQTDERALSDAHRKGSNDYHSVQREPATGKKVLMRDALEKCEISFGPSAGVSCRIGFVAPATAPDRAIRGLAIRHVQGLFTLVTTPPDAYAEAGQQRFLPAAFVHVWSWYGPNNWGSAQLQAWTAKTRGWPLHANINTADGYVRAEMRRCASMQWFWFLEWNKALRVAGIIAPFGPIAIKEMRFLGDFDPTARLCITEEIPLAPEADVLFTDRIPDSFI